MRFLTCSGLTASCMVATVLLPEIFRLRKLCVAAPGLFPSACGKLSHRLANCQTGKLTWRKPRPIARQGSWKQVAGILSRLPGEPPARGALPRRKFQELIPEFPAVLAQGFNALMRSREERRA